MQLQLVGVAGPGEIERAYSAMTKANAEALFVFPSPMLFVERRHIVELATKHRLPSMFTAREYVQLDGLLSYGTNVADMSRRAAIYVDRILKGAKPADLPVEQPTQFEMTVNVKTAKALGVTIARSVLVRADLVIE